LETLKVENWSFPTQTGPHGRAPWTHGRPMSRGTHSPCLPGTWLSACTTGGFCIFFPFSRKTPFFDSIHI